MKRNCKNQICAVWWLYYKYYILQIQRKLYERSLKPLRLDKWKSIDGDKLLFKLDKLKKEESFALINFLRLKCITEFKHD